LGAESLTRYERLARVTVPGADVALLCCTLVTGRTHQIRVHLAASGWPMVGDPVYGQPTWKKVAGPEPSTALTEFPRQALHAWRITAEHPATGSPLQLTAPIAPDLLRLAEATGLAAPGVCRSG
jgi:23S rRNA pseudouridine1911/1915/1917 synthase